MNEIERWLPHRDPFLFVDDVHIEDGIIRASRKFREDEFFFRGHFPDYPVVPGVLLIETLAQAGGVGVKMMDVTPNGLFVLVKVRDASFRRQVRPGETLDIEIHNIKAGPALVHQKGVGKVNGERTVEAEWVCMATGVPE
ncbi:MAG: 3-hydroxyacyl-ACP dehydratase FabZ [Rectinema sp.]